MGETCANVLENEAIARGIFRMRLSVGDGDRDVKPGQFVHLRIPNAEQLVLRRPISVYDFDREKAEMTLICQVVGEGTRQLSLLEEGAELSMLWPLGNGFTLPEGTKTIAAVGGGIGVAPLYYALRRFSVESGAYLGFRGESYAYTLDAFSQIAKVRLCTDDGSAGERGNVVELLARDLGTGARPDLIIACGPTPMLRALKSLVIEHGIPAQFSLEQRMGCGIGACLVCNCQIVQGEHSSYKRVCTDGPVFDAREVYFDG